MGKINIDYEIDYGKFNPEKNCEKCPMFNDGLVPWCNFYGRRIKNWKREEGCKVISINVEEKGE